MSLANHRSGCKRPANTFTMPVLKRFLLAALLGLTALLVNGCASKEDEDTIPWSRPQTWEGTVPGMSSSTITR